MSGTPRRSLVGKGKTMAKIAAIGAAIAGFVFFWRKKHPHTDGPGQPTAADVPPAKPE
jgi:hypothetical protein